MQSFAVRLTLASVVIFGGSYCAAAESPTDPAIQQASYNRTGNNPRTACFARRAPQVGDQLDLNLSVTLQLDSTVRQGDEVLEQAKTAVVRAQRRLVTTTEVTGGMATAALVRYPTATKSLAVGKTFQELSQPKVAPQSVAGKAYRCAREGEKLRVVDEHGDLPPLDEFEIVAQNMDSLGRKNPLSEFLAGRTIAVGDKLALPHEVAEKLLGLGDQMGKVTRFELTLRDVTPVAGATCAIFDATIEASSANSSQMRMEVSGPLTVEVDTCRAIQANLAGPIGMSETRGSLGATYQMAATGKMLVDIRSEYHDLAR